MNLLAVSEVNQSDSLDFGYGGCLVFFNAP